MSARRPEVTSLPRRGPFEGVLFSDTFAGYADGDLIGQGRWVVSEFANNSPQVHNSPPPPNGVRAMANEQVSACVLSVMTAAQLAGSVGGGWWIALTMVPTGRQTHFKDVEIWVGDYTVDAVVVGIAWDTTGGGGAAQQGISYGDTAGAFDSVTPVVGDLTLSHTYALQYRAADRSLRVFVDGVQVGVMTGVDISGVADTRLGFLQSCSAVTTFPVITKVEVGLGMYAMVQ